MKVILSPAMNMEHMVNDKLEKTTPIFTDKACKLAEKLKKINPLELETALNISPKLVDKVFGYYCDFDTKDLNGNGTQALLAFQGLAYKNINVSDFTKEDFIFANSSLRILSSLYGVLKPTDIIQQYRLDFMCSFAKKRMGKKNLYDYWGDDVYKELFADGDTVIGICSSEYEKLINPFLKPWDNYISCKFLVGKNGKYKAQATASKMARGQMARFIVKNKIKDFHKLIDFEYDGFVYSKNYSRDNELAFVR